MKKMNNVIYLNKMYFIFFKSLKISIFHFNLKDATFVPEKEIVEECEEKENKKEFGISFFFPLPHNLQSFLEKKLFTEKSIIFEKKFFTENWDRTRDLGGVNAAF
jgi:hypothetical protein